MNCRASDIIKLRRTPADRINIAKELNNTIFNGNIDLYFPYKEKGFGSIFLLQVISGQKKVIYNYIIYIVFATRLVLWFWLEIL